MAGSICFPQDPGLSAMTHGVVLGYPPDAIGTFIDAQEWADPSEFVAEGTFSADEIADAGFVFYRHDDSREGYEQAISSGERIRERLNELADEWSIPELETFVTEFRNHLRDEAQPETAVP